jgi:hypothetical protein
MEGLFQAIEAGSLADVKHMIDVEGVSPIHVNKVYRGGDVLLNIIRGFSF